MKHWRVITQNKDFPGSKELGQVITYRVAGLLLGIPFLVVLYFVLHSFGYAIIAYLCAAIPVWLSAHWVMIFKLRRPVKAKQSTTRVLLFMNVLQAMCFYSPAAFFLYVALLTYGH